MEYKLVHQAVSMAVILRDIAEPEYINEEHEMLVDIADTMYNANLGYKCLKPEYQKLYDKYGEDFFNTVLKDASAIDSQLTGSGIHERELMLDYQDYLDGVIDYYE